VVFTWTPDVPVVQTEDSTEWEVKVFDSTNPNPFTDLLAIVPRWTHIKYTRPIDDVGAGEIEILKNDPIWLSTPGLLDNNENIWAFYENGELRFTMFAEDIDENHVDDQERPVTKITGRDGAKLFQYAVVLPPSYPSYTDKNHSWAFVRAMQAWMQFFDEANVRGAFPTYIQTTAAGGSDSNGTPYPDISAMEVPPGQDLLSLLRQLAPISEVNWCMTPDFELVIKNTGVFGAHKGQLVVFHVSNSINQLGEKRTRRDIRSHVFLEGGDGVISEVSDSGVVSQWGRREIWLQSGQSKDPTTGSTVAQVTLQAMKNEARELMVKVRPYMTTRKVWIDYTLGDWVTIEWDALENPAAPPLQEEVKIIAISQEVDETGKTDVEIVFNTRLQENQIRLNQIVDKFTGTGGATPAAQSSTPIGAAQIIGVSSLDDLADVVVATPVTNDFLRWDGTKWINQAVVVTIPPPAVPYTIFGDGSDGSVTINRGSAAPSGMSKSGSGATTTFTQGRNMWFNDLTLDDASGSFIWYTQGFRLYVKGTLIVDAAVVIHNDGNSSIATSGGASGAQGFTVGTGANGGSGSSSGSGTGGGAVATVGLGGSGGSGGNETTGGPGGGGGGGGVVTVAPESPHTLIQAMTACMDTNTSPLAYRGGGGGGGGDGLSGASGGGGGGGGGICYIAAYIIQNSGLIRAAGGSGSATGAGACGGGGGGGGGAVMLLYNSGTTGTITTPGGAGGATGGTGSNGANGAGGTTWLMQLT